MGRFVFSTSMLVGVLVLGFSSAAFAHPGHGGGFPAGMAHPFTGLDHMLAMVAVGLWASQLGRRAMIVCPALSISSSGGTPSSSIATLSISRH
jgi:urease accessory protein